MALIGHVQEKAAEILFPDNASSLMPCTQVHKNFNRKLGLLAKKKGFYATGNVAHYDCIPVYASKILTTVSIEKSCQLLCMCDWKKKKESK